MNPSAYVEMAETESVHWWFCGRREILRKIIESMGLPSDAHILEVGSGTGGNLDMLSRFGTVSAMEMDGNAREIAKEKTAGRYEIEPGYCPDLIPFDGERFDLICMFDVLEHIDLEIETLEVLRMRLAPHGKILITVPAYNWLWSPHDIFLHHKRRYTSRRLRIALEKAGLKVERVSYFNGLLLPLAALVRLRDRVIGGGKSSGTKVPAPFINRMLRSVFQSETALLSSFNLPAGVSLLGIARAD